MPKVLKCPECGFKIKGEEPEIDVAEAAKAHFESFHPELADKWSRKELLEMASDD